MSTRSVRVEHVGEIPGQASLTHHHRNVVLTAAAALLAAVVTLRVVLDAETEPLLLMLSLPIALVAFEFGVVGGALAAGGALGTFALDAGLSPVQPLGVAELASRGIPFLLLGTLVGSLSKRTRDAEWALVDVLATYRVLADESSAMISIHAPDGSYVFVSRMCRRLLGYEPEDLIGTASYSYIHPEDISAVRRSHDGVLDTADVWTVSYRVRRKDGRYVWLETTSRTQRDLRTGEVVQIHCASRDVTAREQELGLQRGRVRSSRARIEQVLAANDLTMQFQPIFELGSRRVVGVEALARFPSGPARGPDVWFQEAWELGLGEEMELAAIALAARATSQLPEGAFLAVNASPDTVLSPRLLGVLDAAAPHIVIEITEHAAETDMGRLRHAVAFLRERNVRVAIDDVGTGFSSLKRLLELDPSIMKLDMSLTRGIDADFKRRSLASALAAFGEASNVMVTAEGVETEAELSALRNLGIRYAQGYRLGRPGPLVQPSARFQRADRRVEG